MKRKSLYLPFLKGGKRKERIEKVNLLLDFSTSS